MRIVSQDNNWNFPYELCGLAIFPVYPDGYCIEPIGYNILANLDGNSYFEGRVICMATYSTRQKADKAMGMLNDAYTGLLFAQNLDFPENGMEDLKEMMKRGYGCVWVYESDKKARFEPLNIVWRFPADDEIEV